VFSQLGCECVLCIYVASGDRSQMFCTG
jgi:hypothetical protein